jgi:hypothetical protein
MNYLYEFGGGGWAQSAPVELTNFSVNGELDVSGREIVILSEVLADKVNAGYHELGDNVVRQVDGVAVRNFDHLIELIDKGRSPYVEIVVSRGTKIIFDRSDLLGSTERIIRKFSIVAASNRH